jgi:hypothetical protein
MLEMLEEFMRQPISSIFPGASVRDAVLAGEIVGLAGLREVMSGRLGYLPVEMGCSSKSPEITLHMCLEVYRLWERIWRKNRCKELISRGSAFLGVVDQKDPSGTASSSGSPPRGQMGSSHSE